MSAAIIGLILLVLRALAIRRVSTLATDSDELNSDGIYTSRQGDSAPSVPLDSAPSVPLDSPSVASDRYAKYWDRLPNAGKAAVRKYFDEKDWYKFAALSWYESNNRLTARRLVTNPPKGFLPEDSRGPWQINVIAWPQFRDSNLFNWQSNARAARIVFDAQGFRAWLISSRKLGLA